jgi:hypothetical protein
MNRPSTVQTKDAHLAIAMAIDNLQTTKEHLLRFHYLSDEVDNSAFLVENHHRFAAPDDDTHDVLFARHEKAKQDMSALIASGELDKMKEQLQDTLSFVQKAYEQL